MLAKKVAACLSNPDDSLIDGEESAIVRIFPNGKPGAGGTPDVHDFLMGPRALRHPIEKIEDEGFDDGISHCVFILRKIIPREHTSQAIPYSRFSSARAISRPAAAQFVSSPGSEKRRISKVSPGPL